MPGTYKSYRLLASCLLALLAAVGASAEDLVISPEQQFGFARQLYQNQQYRRAAEEFERFVYFFPDNPHRREAQLRAGDSFLMAGEFNLAVQQLQPLATAEHLDDTAVNAWFALAEAFLKMDQTPVALNRLQNLIAVSNDQRVKDKARFRIGWILLDQSDWKTASEAFAHISPQGRQEYRLDVVESALSNVNSIPHKNPGLAGALSVVPGAGQLYLGRYEDALIAFLLDVGLIWAAVDAFDNEQYALGGLLSFVGAGFYSANIYGAISGAHKYNRASDQVFINRLRQELTLGLGPPGISKQTGGVLLLGFRFEF